MKAGRRVMRRSFKERVDNLLVCFSLVWMNIIYIINESRHTAWAVEYSTIMPLLCEETNTLAKHAPQSPCLCELNELTSTTSLSRFSTYFWVFGHLKIIYLICLRVISVSSAFISKIGCAIWSSSTDLRWSGPCMCKHSLPLSFENKKRTLHYQAW